MNKQHLIIMILMLAGLFAAGQQQANDLVYKGEEVPTDDTTSLLYALKKGHFDGHFRYFFMNTRNEKGLTDYHANAIGGGIRYESARFHNFQFGMSGFSIFNIGSSNLAKADSVTGQFSRYEIGLFDITNPSNRNNLNRLEELFLQYNFKNAYFKLGRQYINSAFINLQDGRMQPTGVSGIYGEIKEIPGITFNLGWLWSISPRSTMQWYSPGASIGIYPVGVNADGTKSGYANNLKCSGIGLVQADWKLNKNLSLKAWNMFVDNIFNTSMLQLHDTLRLGDRAALFAGVQAVGQFSVNDGGNPVADKAYFPKGNRSQTYGARVGWKNIHWVTTLNFNRITSLGRYLIPREWGFDPFFTFLPREKNEGLGNVTAVMGKINYSFLKAGLQAYLAGGYYHLPYVRDYALNKYGMPSYTQVNADIRYSFSHAFKGLRMEFLWVDKIKEGNTYNNDKYIINKVNMTQYNFIVNYYF